jgi:NADPH:quinone reductase-like Zn-dependent oxidoreductase
MHLGIQGDFDMKTVLLNGYGGVDRLQYGDAPTPKPKSGEVLIRMRAASINPVDWKIRSGALREMMPVEFPAILGRDVAGEIVDVGDEMDEIEAGDRVLALVRSAYAEFVIAKSNEFAGIPRGLRTEDAAALPLVLLTGAQLIEDGVKPRQGETILVTGAVGSVGRTAVYVAKQHGARVIAGVRENQREQAQSLGADEIVAIDSEAGIAKIPEVDAIADTVDHDTIEKLLPRIRQGGRLGSVLGKPKGADARSIQVNAVFARPDARRLRELAEDVRDGKFSIPISARFPLAEVREAQTLAEKGASGKVLLLG